MRTIQIAGERERGRRDHRFHFRGRTTRATGLAVVAKKAATFRRLAFTLTTSAIFAGLVVTPASAIPNGAAMQPPPPPTCPKNFWAMDIQTTEKIGTLLSGTVLKEGGNQALIALDFNPACKQANIVVEYEGVPTGWTVDIGDSITNDGWGGGSGSPGKACAEVQVLNSVVTHYRDCGGSEVLPLAPTLVPSPLSLQDGALKFVVKNDYVSVGQPFAKSEYTGKSFHIPDTIYPDPDGSKIFAAFNRTVKYRADRVGTGVRRVMITMK